MSRFRCISPWISMSRHKLVFWINEYNNEILFRANELAIANSISLIIKTASKAASTKCSLKDVPAKKRNNKYLWRSSLFSEATGPTPLVYFSFSTIPMLMKIRNIFRYKSKWLILLAYRYFNKNSHCLLFSFQWVSSFLLIFQTAANPLVDSWDYISGIASCHITLEWKEEDTEDATGGIL